jgi:hypothetical protein
MGRETNQGEIAVEFDGQFYRITFFLSVSFDQTFLFKRKVWLLKKKSLVTQYDAPQEAENDSSNQNQ